MVAMTSFSGRRALGIVAAGLTLGAMADGLLRVAPWGLNAAVFACALAAILFYFALPSRKQLSLLIAMFGVFFIWRDSPALKALDVVAIVFLCSTIALPEWVTRLSRSTAAHYTLSAIDSAVGCAIGALLIAIEDLHLPNPVNATNGTKHYWLGRARSAAIGVLIAVPLLFVFGGLFVSADEAFRNFVNRFTDLDWDWLAQHAAIIFFVSWAMTGFLRVVGLNLRTHIPVQRYAEAFRLDTLAVLVPLTLLNALFLAFISVQFQYFFGGNALVTHPSGPSYSEYARQGFFQLVAVALLALLTLYAADWLNRDAAPGMRRLFRILATALIALVYVVMASALHRMYLYYQAYGLTQLRFYTTVFMAWLAIIILAFALIVLAGKRDRYVFFTMVSAWIFLVALHVLNPDATIVRANIVRSSNGAPFDAKYAGCGLSADAIPALVAARDGQVKPQVDQAIACWMRTQGKKNYDWRVWNYSAWRATKLTNGTGITP